MPCADYNLGLPPATAKVAAPLQGLVAAGLVAMACAGCAPTSNFDPPRQSKQAWRTPCSDVGDEAVASYANSYEKTGAVVLPLPADVLRWFQEASVALGDYKDSESLLATFRDPVASSEAAAEVNGSRDFAATSGGQDESAETLANLLQYSLLMETRVQDLPVPDPQEYFLRVQTQWTEARGFEGTLSKGMGSLKQKAPQFTQYKSAMQAAREWIGCLSNRVAELAYGSGPSGGSGLEEEPLA